MLLMLFVCAGGGGRKGARGDSSIAAAPTNSSSLPLSRELVSEFLVLGTHSKLAIVSVLVEACPLTRFAPQATVPVNFDMDRSGSIWATAPNSITGERSKPTR